jgi:hypothetical protein
LFTTILPGIRKEVMKTICETTSYIKIKNCLREDPPIHWVYPDNDWTQWWWFEYNWPISRGDKK